MNIERSTAIMLRIALACLLLIISALPGLPADLTGKWTGAAELVGEDGQAQNRPVIFNLAQEGAAVTGTAGYEENLVAPISNGKFERAKLTLTVVADIEYRVELTLVSDNRLEGVAKFTPPGAPEISAKIGLTRAQSK
jgi:hypothetical protein